MKESILQLSGKKHIKIFKLHQQGLTKKEIAELLKTNTGHVGNVLKDYTANPKKAEAADAIVIEGNTGN